MHKFLHLPRNKQASFSPSYILYIISFVYVCVCECVKAIRFDIPERIATKLYTRTKDLPGNVLMPILISLTYLKGRFS